MFAIFVLIIVIVGLVSTLGYTIFSFQNTAEMNAMVLRNTMRMDTIAMTLRAASRPLVPGGPARLPLGELIPGDDENPERLIIGANMVGGNKTPWGQEYGYCIYNTSAVAGEIPFPGQGEESWIYSRVDGVDYVIAHDGVLLDDFPDETILGFVISPPPNRKHLPECSQIVFKDGVFLIDPNLSAESTPRGGIVVPIMGSIRQPNYQEFKINNTLYVEDNLDIDNPGSGESEDTPIPLADALVFWGDSVLPELILEIEGNATIPSNSVIGNKYGRGTLHLKGGNLSDENTNWINVRGGIVLDNTQLSPNIVLHVLPGGDLHILNSSTVGRIVVDGGSVIVESGTVINVAGDDLGGRSPIEVISGSLKFTHGASADTSGKVSITTSSLPSPTPPAIHAIGGTVSLLTDLEALPFSLPWKIEGAAKMDIGVKDVAALEPALVEVAYNHGDPDAIPAVAFGVADIDSGVAQVECPSIRPHAVSGSCIASSGMLSSSGSDGDSWTCVWSAFEEEVNGILVSIPLPADGKATALCSISP